MLERHDPGEIISGFGQPLFGVLGPGLREPRFSGSGWSLDDDDQERITSVKLDYLVERDHHVHVETSVGRQPAALHAHNVIMEATWQTKRVRFPLTLTVTREDRQLPVDGQPHTFSVLTCRRAAIAAGSVDGREVTISCRAALLRKLALTRLDEKAVAALVRRAKRERH